MLQFPSQSAMKELSQINKLMAYLKKNDEKILPWMLEGDRFLDTDPGLTDPSRPVGGGTR